MTDQPSSDQVFTLGEIVIVIPLHTVNPIAEGTIVGMPRDDDWLDINGKIVDKGWYAVNLSCGRLVQVLHSQLRKRRQPPREDQQLVHWGDVVWQPNRVIA